MATYRIHLAGRELAFDAAADTPLLLAAEQAGISLPNSCRNGTCRTCLARVRHGHTHHLIDWPGLSPEEKQSGHILPCVCVADSDLELDVSAARLSGPAPV